MASLNRLFLIGNLTRDPELRKTASGTSVTGFCLAVNRKFKGADGSQKEETVFIDVKVWGSLADLVCKFLRKGDQTMVEGRLEMDTWDDKQTGEKRSKLCAVAEGIQFIHARREEERPVTRSSMRNPEPDIDLSIGDKIPF